MGILTPRPSLTLTAKKHDTVVNDHEIMDLFLLLLFISACNGFQVQDQGLLLQEKNKSLTVMPKHQTFKKCDIFYFMNFFLHLPERQNIFSNFPYSSWRIL